MRPRLHVFIPSASTISVRERLRSAGGALIGILLTGLLSRSALGRDAALPLLIAPMGASAVLLFAVPASPLAQPWSILGGNLLSATVGVAMASSVADPLVASALAIAVAIALMTALRCLHPPSGAVALTAVLGGPAVQGLGYGFVLWPVAGNSLLLLLVALLFNNLVGRSYPHRPMAPAPDRRTSDPPALARVGFASEDLDAVLAEYDSLLDVDRGDLEAILRQAEIRSYRRRSGQMSCASIMSRNVVAVAPEASIAEAFDLLRAHHIKVVPVTNDAAEVVGIVTQTDLLEKAIRERRGFRLDFRHRIGLTAQRGRAPNASVADIMTTPVRTIAPDALLADVVRSMAATGLHYLPVVEETNKLVGIVSQSDLIVALLAESAERSAGRPAAG